MRPREDGDTATGRENGVGSGRIPGDENGCIKPVKVLWSMPG